MPYLKIKLNLMIKIYLKKPAIHKMNTSNDFLHKATIKHYKFRLKIFLKFLTTSFRK